MMTGFNLKEAIIEALTELGGVGTSDQVKGYLKTKFGKEWEEYHQKNKHVKHVSLSIHLLKNLEKQVFV